MKSFAEYLQDRGVHIDWKSRVRQGKESKFSKIMKVLRGDI